MNTRKVGIITKSNIALLTLMEQLKDYFEPAYKVIGYCIDDGIREVEEAEHFFITSQVSEIYEYAQELVPPGSSVSVAGRFFEPSQLKWLMAIPEGTDVLVINNLPGTCREVIQNLLEANIDHLNYVPLYPGCNVDSEDYKFAITLDEPEVMPAARVELIDIGVRKIHIKDLIDVGRRLNVPVAAEQRYLGTFISEMFELGKELGHYLADYQKLNHHLKATFQVVKEPMIAVDTNGVITFINRVAADLFECEEQEVLGAHFTTLPHQQKIKTFFQNQADVEDSLVQLNDQYFVVSCEEITDNRDKLGTMCMFKNVTELRSLEKKIKKELVKKGHSATYQFRDIKGNSDAIKKTIKLARKMAKSNGNVLITGENGTGKELFAHSIHQDSNLSDGPFVAINCAAFPDNLLESELFGYEEGAFTGAKKGGKPGVFELADKGTIFLDEIGEIPLNIQVKLLRVLQERQVVRIGGTHVIDIDCRIIAATNKPLKQAIQHGEFRQDLFFRLNVLPLIVPPLRERIEDIPVLVSHYLAAHHQPKAIHEHVLSELAAYHWPGNIRELINVLDFALTISEENEITIDNLPENLQGPVSGSDAKVLQVDLEELEILNCLYQCRLLNKSVGRYQLLEFPAIKKHQLTDWKLRNRLAKLEEKGLVQILSTRQGTVITEKGAAVLKEHPIHG